MTIIGVGVLAGIGACVGLGATAPVAARRAYRRARARAAQHAVQQTSVPLAIAHEVMIPVEVRAERPAEKVAMLRVDFRQLEPQHITRTTPLFAPEPEFIPTQPSEPTVIETVVYKALPEDLSQYVTIVEVMRRLGVEISNEKTWSLGRQARDLHVKQYGVPPRKVLRQKTNGTGSHDFSGYPPEFVETIERLITDNVSRETKEVVR